ncbi:MAG: hypothetical protein WCL50_07345 [Spirochaetota bacterium]
MKRVLILASLALCAAASLVAIDIYPIDRAQILAGEIFDFKVELDGYRNPTDVQITINGQD